MASPGWSDIKEDLSTSSRQRLNGLEGLEALLSRTSLGKSELGELVDLSKSLLSDASSKVTQQTLEALALVTSRADVPLNSFVGQLVQPVAERLCDSRQPVRAQAFQVLVSYFNVIKPEVVLDRLSPLWQHKSWKVKQGLLQVIAEVVSKTGPSFLGGRDQNNAVLKQIVRMMEEPELCVREAAIECLGEIYRQAPAAVVSTVNTSSLRPVQQREVLSRLGVSPVASDTGAPDASSKRSSGGLNMYNSDTGLASCSSGGGYVMPDMSAPVTASTNNRISGSGAAGPSSSVVDIAPARSAAAPAATVKRGGFKDGGGVTIDGELPAAAPIPITSERELRAELENATATLAKAPNTEWQERMDAMQRVEGLVLGGAVEWECFHEAMKGLTQALSQQFKERRSTIARQTCHLIGVLARYMGPRFEPHAVTLLPTLFGVLVITVAVMAESADVGVRGILRHCQTGRVLQTISDGVSKEKNPKTRQYCAMYLVQILEQWDVGVWSRHLDAVEAAIRSAAQDSSADTRQYGRTAMALYHSSQPERAQAFLKRLDSGLRDKLAVGVTGGKPSKPSSAAVSRQSNISAAIAARRMTRQTSVASTASVDTADAEGILVMVLPKAERRLEPAAQPADATDAVRPRMAVRTGPSSAGVSTTPALVAVSSSNEASTAPAPSEAPVRPLAATLGRASRKSLALPPGRIPGGSADLTSILGESSSNSVCDTVAQARITALRRPRMSAIPFEPAQRELVAAPPIAHAVRIPEPVAAARVQVSELQLSRPAPVAPAPLASARCASSRSGGTYTDSGGGAADTSTSGPVASSGGLVPLQRVVNVIVGGPRTWNEKVEALSALTAHVRASVAAGPSSSPGRGFGSDTGFGSAAGHPPPLAVEPEKLVLSLERVRDRLVEALEDPHQKVLAAALTLLAEVVRAYGRVLEGQLDRVLPLLLNKAAENKEQSRALCAGVLNECGQAYRPDVLVPALTKCLDMVKLPRGKQLVLEFFRGRMDRWTAVNVTLLKHWLVRLAPLLDDRTPDLRRCASGVLDALLTVPWAREPINYVAYQHNNADMAPLRRYLGALNGAGPSATATISSSSAGTAGDGNTGTLSAQFQALSITVSGGPPATTSNNRRQLPSAAPTLPVAPPAPKQPQAAVTAAYPNVPGGVQQLSQGLAGPKAGVERPGPSGTTDGQGRWTGATAQVQSQSQHGQAPSQAMPGRQGAPAFNALMASCGGLDCGGGGGGLQMPRDPGGQVAYLAQLVDAARFAVGGAGGTSPSGGALASPDQLLVAMDALADAAEHCGEEVWVRMFPTLMVELSAWAKHAARPVRTMAYVLLKQLVSHQPCLFTDNNLDTQAGLLLQGCGDEVREISVTASCTLRLLLEPCNERHGMLLLLQLLPRERELHRRAQDKGARLVAVLDGIRQLAARLQVQELQGLTFTPHPETSTTLLEALVPNLMDTETSVRRMAVVTLADLWYRLGHRVRDVLQVLAASSYNLMCIYYLKLHGVAVVTGQTSPTEHPLVLGGGGGAV